MKNKGVEEQYTSYYEFRKNARKQRLEIQGRDFKKITEFEEQVLSGLKKQTTSMMSMCVEDATVNAHNLATIESQTRDWRCGSTRPAGPERHTTPTLVTRGIPSLGRGRAVGSVTFWNHLKTLEDCINSRTDVSVIPPDGSNVSQPTYSEPCRSQGRAEITGSGEDNITHSCTVTMEHDFEFMAADPDKYRFTPEFFINAIVSLSGEGPEFGNNANISIQIKIGNNLRGVKTVLNKSDSDLLVEPVSISSPPSRGPSAIATLEANQTILITVACVLYVEATNLAHVLLDLDSSNHLYYWSPRLRVDREKETVPLYENESGGEVIEEPVVDELPDPPWPYKGFRFGK